jgi:hypothetical protein
MRYANPLFLILIFIVSCTSQNKFTKAGVIRYTAKFYDSLTQQYTSETIFPDMKVWYNKELFIEEIKTVETYRDTNGVTTRKTPIAYYLFMDRNSKSFYHYSSFSDTARILDKYILPDTAVMRGVGGWSFYRNWDLEIAGSLKTLDDTVINKIAYRRVRLPIMSNGFLVTITAFQRCDRIGSVFQFDKNLGNKLGCPVTRVDYLPSSEDPTPISSELNFLRDSLSKEELKVFAAWEKNIKKYPINK